MANNFTFHEVSEQEKEQIRKNAKSIMDSFATKLDKVKLSDREPFIERKYCERKEGGESCFLDKKVMFENAPNKNENFITAEKGAWTAK